MIPSRLSERPHKTHGVWMYPCEVVTISLMGFSEFWTAGYAPTFDGVAKIRSFLK